MSEPLFLVDAERLRAGDRIVLDGDEGRHAVVVRRITAGEAVALTDGHGHLARCVVSEAGRSGLVCDVRDRSDVPPPTPRIVVVQAPAKADRAELAVEMMTEVGIDEIVPWAAQRRVVRWEGERGEKALRRWRLTARAAAKQSRRVWLPDVTEQQTTGQVVERLRTATLAVGLHEEATTPLSAIEPPADGEVVLVVGPEGGIAPQEMDAFQAAGARSVRLGPNVLRTSTAGAVAAGVLLSRTARWSI